jgi:hypothetical protein
MLISELLGESITHTPLVITTSRFDKEAQHMITSQLKTRLDKWLTVKKADPLTLVGTDDRTSSYEPKGWNHYHLKKGQVLVHYQAVPDYIMLASVTDHRSMDGKTQEAKALVKYLKDLNPKQAVAQYKQMQQPMTPEPPLWDVQMLARARDLIYELAITPDERENLEQLAAVGDITNLQDYFEIESLPLDLASVQKYQTIAQEAVRSIPAPQ